MEISGGGSGDSGVYAPEIAETLRFEEEIHSLIHSALLGAAPPACVAGSSSFTALLGLPPSHAADLLHDADPVAFLPLPSNAALLDRAARFSVFAAEDPARPQAEPPDSGSPPQRPAKRKEKEKSKAKGDAKKSRVAEENTGGEQLPYVHVRARRGQATDSHSLAERARREKINYRMKLLQELVPGCSKITGTALVLEEIINHVQSLQRQVEILSMRLAAANPRIHLGGLGLDAFLSSFSSSAEQQQQQLVGVGAQAEEGIEGGKWHRTPILCHVDDHHHHHQQQQQGEHVLAINGNATDPFSLLGYYDVSSSASVSSHSNQLKMEL